MIIRGAGKGARLDSRPTRRQDVILIAALLIAAALQAAHAQPDSCYNFETDGDETDVDCGGSCVPCLSGYACSADADCQSSSCVDNACEANCQDGEQNQDETDWDCGGSVCDGCPNSWYCLVNSDCLSNNCVSGVCQGSCTDGVLGDSETDVDCGGPDCDGCGEGDNCFAGDDCLSGICDTDDPYAFEPQFTCFRSCSDNEKNGPETDVDCGGGNGDGFDDCPRCDLNKACAADSDCSSRKCTDNVCAESCFDGLPNQDEQGIDCGGVCQPCSCTNSVQDAGESDVDCGAVCPQTLCPAGSTCNSNSDCAGNQCDAGGDGTCQANCFDGVKNGAETDTDCGGGCAAKCGLGKTCEDAGGAPLNDSCASNFCDFDPVDGVFECAVASCSDGLQNGLESDVDCGGAASGCDRCFVGQFCESDDDCLSSSCASGGGEGGFSVCQPSCTDTELNGDELGIDCGGSCPNECDFTSCMDIYERYPKSARTEYHPIRNGDSVDLTFCIMDEEDVSSGGGGWTVIYMDDGSGSDLDLTDDPAIYSENTLAAVETATEVMIGLMGSVQQFSLADIDPCIVCSTQQCGGPDDNIEESATPRQWVRFAMPEDWRTQFPGSYARKDLETMAWLRDDTAPISRTVRYGNNGFKDDCAGAWVDHDPDDPLASVLGRICVKDTLGPFYHGFAKAGSPEYCADSSQTVSDVDTSDLVDCGRDAEGSEWVPSPGAFFIAVRDNPTTCDELFTRNPNLPIAQGDTANGLYKLWPQGLFSSAASTRSCERPTHCTNGDQDIESGEVGVDCGGPCGGYRCDGAGDPPAAAVMRSTSQPEGTPPVALSIAAPTSPRSDSKFGSASALRNGVLAVGATGYGTTGAAFVYAPSLLAEGDLSSTWVEELAATPTDTTESMAFGTSVTLSPAGSVLAVGAPLAATSGGGSGGKVYVFSSVVDGVDGSRTWDNAAHQILLDETNPKANALCGSAVSFDDTAEGEGQRLAVGCPAYATSDNVYETVPGKVIIYVRGADLSWTEEQELFGDMTDMGSQPKLLFGTTLVFLAADHLIVGEPGSLHKEGDTYVANTGSVIAFERDSGSGLLVQLQTLRSTDKYTVENLKFGSGIAADQHTLVVAAQYDGSAVGGADSHNNHLWVFVADADYSAWSAVHRIDDTHPDPNNVYFGSNLDYTPAMSISGSILAVGVPFADAGGADRSGEIALFRRRDGDHDVDESDNIVSGGKGAWVHVGTMSAPSPESGDQFGFTVQLEGRVLAAGATNAQGGVLGGAGGGSVTLGLLPNYAAAEIKLLFTESPTLVKGYYESYSRSVFETIAVDDKVFIAIGAPSFETQTTAPRVDIFYQDEAADVQTDPSAAVSLTGAANSLFGFRIAMTTTETRLVIAVSAMLEGNGRVHLFASDRSSDTTDIGTTPIDTLSGVDSSDEKFGYGLAADGGIIVVGSTAGGVFVFAESATTDDWELKKSLSNGQSVALRTTQHFGYAVDVAMHTDSSSNRYPVVVVGEEKRKTRGFGDDTQVNHGRVYVFWPTDHTDLSGTWNNPKLLQWDRGSNKAHLGWSVSVSSTIQQGILVAAGAPKHSGVGSETGAAVIFTPATKDDPSSDWSLAHTLQATVPDAGGKCGISVRLHDSEPELAMGCISEGWLDGGTGAVYIFTARDPDNMADEFRVSTRLSLPSNPNGGLVDPSGFLDTQWVGFGLSLTFAGRFFGAVRTALPYRTKGGAVEYYLVKDAASVIVTPTAEGSPEPVVPPLVDAMITAGCITGGTANANSRCPTLKLEPGVHRSWAIPPARSFQLRGVGDSVSDVVVTGAKAVRTLSIDSVNAELYDLTFTGGDATDWSTLSPIASGGVIRVASVDGNDRISVLIRNCVISGGRAQRGGGLFASGGVDVELSSVDVEANDAGAGGGVYVAEAASVTLTTVTLDSNIAHASGGGGVLVEAATAVLRTNSVLSNNEALLDGGGASVGFLGELVVVNTAFTANAAGQNGGGLAADRTTVTVAGTSFTDNSAGLDGGGVFLSTSSAQSTISSSTFTTNTASENGGAVATFKALVDLDGVDVTQNTADGTGGGLWLNYGSSSGASLDNDISGSTFDDNDAVLGGGLYCAGCDVDISGGTFSSNGRDSATRGGGMYCTKTSVEGVVTVATSSFSDNEAEDAGGGYYADGCTTNIVGGTMSGNLVTGAITRVAPNRGGGAVFATAATADDDSSLFSGITMSANQAPRGAAFYLVSSDDAEGCLSDVSSCAGGDGSPPSSHYTVTDITFTDNTASAEGDDMLWVHYRPRGTASTGGDINDKIASSAVSLAFTTANPAPSVVDTGAVWAATHVELVDVYGRHVTPPPGASVTATATGARATDDGAATSGVTSVVFDATDGVAKFDELVIKSPPGSTDSEVTFTVSDPEGITSLVHVIEIDDCDPGSEPSGRDCVVCEAGSASADGLGCLDCTPGTYADVTGLLTCKTPLTGYAAVGAAATEQTLCVAGEYPNEDQSQCLDCSPSQYSTGGQESCSNCGVGTYPLNEGGKNTGCQDCGSGSVSLGGTQTCTACEPGTAPDSLKSVCVSCDANAVSADGSACVACSAGEAPNEQQSTCEACPPGTAGNDEGSACTACAPGTKQDSPGQTSCDSCGQGEYQDESGEQGCKPVSVGHISVGTPPTSQEPCGVGTVPNDNKDACETCPAGWVSSGGVAECQQCAPHLVANEEQSACTACGAGEVPSADQSTCDVCSDGSVSAGGVAECTTCGAGSVPNESNSACEPCADGYVNPGGEAACTKCNAGTVPNVFASACVACDNANEVSATGESCVACDEGSVPNSEASECEECPAGRYMRADGSACDNCVAGTVQPLTGQTACNDCGNGEWQDLAGQALCNSVFPGYKTTGTPPTGQLICPAGTVPDDDSRNCVDCDAGWVAASGASVCVQCDPGEEPDSVSSACVSCLADEVSASGVECVPCGDGEYPADDGSECLPCPVGTRGTDGSECVACNSGEYQDDEGQTECLLCEDGHVSSKGAEACAACGAGQQPNAAKNACEQCAGNFVSADGVQCEQCSPGSRPGTGQASCVLCSPGEEGDALGSSCSDCTVGRYSAIEGARSCTPCPIGRYQGLFGRDECLNVTAGFVVPEAEGAIAQTPCGIGEFSYNSTWCSTCPAGHAAPAASASCTQCTAGQEPSALRDACDRCDSTSVSPDGVECAQCGDGMRPKFPDQAECESCPLGTAGSGGECDSCTFGSFAGVVGMTDCELCPPGSYGDQEGLPLCTTCPLGTYSSAWGATSAAQCEACHEGTTTEAPGASSIDDCVPEPGKLLVITGSGENATIEALTCPEGAICDDGATPETLQLQAGYWRVSSNTTTVRKCPVESWCMGGAIQGQEVATSLCAPGHGGAYCAVCLEGYYMSGSECITCDEVSPTQLVATIIVLLCMLAAFLCCANLFRKKVDKRKAKKKGGAEIPGAAKTPVAGRTANPMVKRTAEEKATEEKEASSNHAQLRAAAAFGDARGVAMAREMMDTMAEKAGDDDVGVRTDAAAMAGDAHGAEVPEGAANAFNGGDADGPDLTGAAGAAGEMDYDGAGEAVARATAGVDTTLGLDDGAEGADLTGAAGAAGEADYEAAGDAVERVVPEDAGDAQAGGGAVGVDGGGMDADGVDAEAAYDIDTAAAAEVDVEAMAEFDPQNVDLGGHEEVVQKAAYGAAKGIGNNADKIAVHAGSFAGKAAEAGTWIQKTKIGAGTMQLIMSAHTTLTVDWPPEFTTFIKYFSVLELDLAAAVSLGCVGRNYYSDMVTMMTVVLVVFIVLGLLIRYGPRHLKRKFVQILLVFSFATYAPVNTKIFAALNCEDFEDGSSYLKADYSIDCNADDRSNWIFFTMMCIVGFTIGVPGGYLAVLRANRDHINPQGVINGVEPGSLMYMDAQIELRNTYPELKPIKGLFEAYEPQYYYMEVFLLISKVLLTGFVVFADPGSSTQVVYSIFIATVTLYVYAETKPFVSDRDDAMNTFAQMALVVTLLGALVIKAGIAREGGYEDFMGSIMIAVNIGLGVMFLKFVVWLEISDRLTRMRKEHPLISKSKLHYWRLFAKPDFEMPEKKKCSCEECKQARQQAAMERERRVVEVKSAPRGGRAEAK